MTLRSILTGVLPLLGIIAVFFAPRLGNSLFSRVERLGVRLAGHQRLAVASIALAAVLLRLLILFWIPVPVPEVADEFSYLLAGDTFAHGRLTNPPHPMWIHFETFHELQQPTYMSKYFPGQGAFLAFGEILGHPWIGVLLSVALMCAAILWALQAWLPPQWALLGGILAVLRFAIDGYWINSYWGGAVAALGGALVIGALPRILRFHRPRDAVILGLGAALLLNSRPLEGFVFCLPVAGALLLWLFRAKRPRTTETLRRFALPVGAVALLCALFNGYYNWRVAGNALVVPYALHEKTYATTTPSFQWQKEGAPLEYHNPQLADFYGKHGWAHATWRQRRITDFRSFVSLLHSNMDLFVSFFLYPELLLPLVLAAPWLLRDRRVRLLVGQTILCLAGSLLVVWYLPHYSAPLTATLVALAVQGIRHLRTWQLVGRPVGLGLSRLVVLLAVAQAPYHAFYADLLRSLAERAQIERRLDATPGEHLIVVRYSPNHYAPAEWVFNSADIDRAKIVWAKEIPGVDSGPLLRYFASRQVWLLEPDISPPRLTPYNALADQSRISHGTLLNRPVEAARLAVTH